MSEPRVLRTSKGACATLVLNRPEVGNAVDLELARELLAAAIACDEDPAVRCVVLTGAGRLFCAGGDVAVFQAGGDAVGEVVGELAATVHQAASRLARMAKPLLVLVNGPAAGAGFGLAMLGDLVIAASSASFTAAYGALGLSPDAGLTWLLPRLIGLRRAQEVILANRSIDAATAGDWNLVTRVVDDAELAAAGSQATRRLLTQSAPAIGATRLLLLDSPAATFETHLEDEARTIAALSLGPEAREGVSAFLQKRKPSFCGVERA